jgi:hypothetical protein
MQRAIEREPKREGFLKFALTNPQSLADAGPHCGARATPFFPCAVLVVCPIQALRAFLLSSSSASRSSKKTTLKFGL